MSNEIVIKEMFLSFLSSLSVGKSEELQGEIDEATVPVGDFNLLRTDGTRDKHWLGYRFEHHDQQTT